MSLPPFGRMVVNLLECCTSSQPLKTSGQNRASHSENDISPPLTDYFRVGSF